MNDKPETERVIPFSLVWSHWVYHNHWAQVKRRYFSTIPHNIFCFKRPCPSCQFSVSNFAMSLIYFFVLTCSEVQRGAFTKKSHGFKLLCRIHGKNWLTVIRTVVMGLPPPKIRTYSHIFRTFSLLSLQACKLLPEIWKA